MGGTQAGDPSDEGEFGAAEETEKEPRPSPLWFGALMSISLLIGVCWLLSYALLDWGWQQSLGGWNYLIALVFIVTQGQLMEHWHGFPRRP